MKTTKHTLSNGLRVILVPQKDAVTVTMLTLVGTGSNKETLKQNGLSHFLEHVCFKGTETRPTAKMINEEFEEIGAITNAFTGDEYTGYYAKSHPKHIAKLVTIVGDVVMNASLPANEIEKEKGVVVEEINMYEDMPQAKVMETLSTLLYGDSAAGRSVIGTKESVRAFTRADIVSYKSQYYTAKNTVVAVVGSFDESAVLETVRKTFAALPKGGKDANAVVKVSAKTPRVAAITKPIDQTHVAIGFPSVPLGDEDGAAVSLLSTILGGGMSSRLFHHLREELGVAYYVRAEQDAHSTYGEFVITAGIDTVRTVEVLGAIKGILKDIKKNPVSDKELSKAREFTVGMIGMGLEATDSMAGFCATQALLMGTIRTPQMLAREYRRVTPADITRVAKKILDSKKLRISLVGPKADIERVGDIFADL